MLPALIASAFVGSPEEAMLSIFVALMGFQIAIGNIQTLPSDFFSGKSVGTLAGIGGTSAVLGRIDHHLAGTRHDDRKLHSLLWDAALLVPLGIFAVFFLSGSGKPKVTPTENM